MTLEEAEARVGVTLPPAHRQAMLNLVDPIHSACDFLVLNSPYKLLRWLEVNESLHGREPNGWPAFLVAFASNGCGDYFAYDTRFRPPRVIYIDPDLTVQENLVAEDRLEYDSFAEWYGACLAQRHS